jgi:hypothetical protein
LLIEPGEDSDQKLFQNIRSSKAFLDQLGLLRILSKVACPKAIIAEPKLFKQALPDPLLTRFFLKRYMLFVDLDHLDLPDSAIQDATHQANSDSTRVVYSASLSVDQCT